MTNRIKIRFNGHRSAYRYRYLIRKVVNTALECENVYVPCMVAVSIITDEEIHELNLEFMGRGRPTDVLSFPMQSLSAGNFVCDEKELDVRTNMLPLGDVIISLERAKEQAAEYGHSTEREIAYLTVHSILHLLGYDHVDEGEEKAKMRAREEYILGKLNITRE